MYYYKNADGSVISAYKRVEVLEEITEEEYTMKMNGVLDRTKSYLPEPTAEERLEALEGAVLEMMGVVTDG